MFNKDQAIVTDFFRLILFRVNKKNYPKLPFQLFNSYNSTLSSVALLVS